MIDFLMGVLGFVLIFLGIILAGALTAPVFLLIPLVRWLEKQPWLN